MSTEALIIADTILRKRIKNITQEDIVLLRREIGVDESWLEPTKELSRFFLPHVKEIATWIEQPEDIVIIKSEKGTFTKIEFNLILIRILINSSEL